MVSTPGGCTKNSMMTYNPSMSTKKPSAGKSLRQSTDTLDVKHKTGICRFVADKANRKAIKKGNVLWSKT